MTPGLSSETSSSPHNVTQATCMRLCSRSVDARRIAMIEVGEGPVDSCGYLAFESSPRAKVRQHLLQICQAAQHRRRPSIETASPDLGHSGIPARVYDL